MKISKFKFPVNYTHRGHEEELLLHSVIQCWKMQRISFNVSIKIMWHKICCGCLELWITCLPLWFSNFFHCFCRIWFENKDIVCLPIWFTFFILYRRPLDCSYLLVCFPLTLRNLWVSSMKLCLWEVWNLFNF